MTSFVKMAGALTDAEFMQAVKKFSRLSAKGRTVAYSILVEGKSIQWIEEHLSTKRQQACKWASHIYEVFQPEGWVTESITLPPELMEQVREIERNARDAWQKSLGPSRIVKDRQGETK